MLVPRGWIPLRLGFLLGGSLGFLRGGQGRLPRPVALRRLELADPLQRESVGDMH